MRKEVLLMNHFPVGMETFGAASVTSWEIIKDTIDQSDYYVLIVGRKYGSTILDGEDQGMSYMEKEYWYARERNIPVIAFIASDDADLPVDEDNDKREALLKFKKEIESHLQVEWWTGSRDLSSKVSASLYNEFSRNPRDGWIRGGSGLNEDSTVSKVRDKFGDSNQVSKKDGKLLKYDDCILVNDVTPNFLK